MDERVAEDLVDQLAMLGSVLGLDHLLNRLNLRTKQACHVVVDRDMRIDSLRRLRDPGSNQTRSNERPERVMHPALESNCSISK
jgi:hypothetical protein